MLLRKILRFFSFWQNILILWFFSLHWKDKLLISYFYVLSWMFQNRIVWGNERKKHKEQCWFLKVVNVDNTNFVEGLSKKKKICIFSGRLLSKYHFSAKWTQIPGCSGSARHLHSFCSRACAARMWQLVVTAVPQRCLLESALGYFSSLIAHIFLHAITQLNDLRIEYWVDHFANANLNDRLWWA